MLLIMNGTIIYVCLILVWTTPPHTHTSSQKPHVTYNLLWVASPVCLIWGTLFEWCTCLYSKHYCLYRNIAYVECPKSVICKAPFQLDILSTFYMVHTICACSQFIFNRRHMADRRSGTELHTMKDNRYSLLLTCDGEITRKACKQSHTV